MENRVDLVDKLYQTGLLEDDEQLLLSNGFDDAIIGITATAPKRVVYNYYKAIDLIMREDSDMDLDEVVAWLDEHMSFDMGDQTPIFLKLL